MIKYNNAQYDLKQISSPDPGNTVKTEITVHVGCIMYCKIKWLVPYAVK